MHQAFTANRDSGSTAASCAAGRGARRGNARRMMVALGAGPALALVVAGCGSTHHAAASTTSTAATSVSGSSGGASTAPAAATSSGGGSGGTAVTCPSLATVSGLAGVTYTSMTTQKPSAFVPQTACIYLTGGSGLTIAYYPKGTALSIMTSVVQVPLTGLSGLGEKAETTANPPGVYVFRSSAPSVAVQNEATNIPLAKLVSLTRAVLGGG